MKEFSLSTLSAALIGALMAAMCLPVLAQESRTLPVTVVDKDRKVVEGLTAANFRATVRKEKIGIVSAELDSSTKQIIILLDTSGSMGRLRRTKEFPRGVVQDAVDRLSERHEVSLYTFSDGPLTQVSLEQAAEKPVAGTRKPERLRKKMRGKTALLDAVAEALSLLSGDTFGSVIYIVSDGGENHSKSTLRKLATAANGALVRLFYFCLSDPIIERMSTRVEDPCDWLGRVSGGAGVAAFAFRFGERQPQHVPWAEMRPEGLKLLPLMESVYRVEIELPSAINKRRKWKLEVVDENGKKMKGVKVHYPRYLVPLEGPQPE